MVYTNSEEIKRKAKEASYDELERNPKQLEYTDRTRTALVGGLLEQVDTRTTSREKALMDKTSLVLRKGLAQDNKEIFGTPIPDSLK